MVGCIYRHFKGISIHASAKEATTVSSFSGVTEYFNPRLREGGDKEYLRNNGGKKNFNPRLREGGDGIQRHNRLEESKISIHASAKEATCRRIICIFIILFYFNPRLREGGDVCTLQKLLSGVIFQSTPPRRRRPHGGKWHEFNQYFNPRLREGGDDKVQKTGVLRIFQSTPPRRRRQQQPENLICAEMISIHASAKEATSSIVTDSLLL